MQVYKFVEASNEYSVPFDWDEEDENIDYVSNLVDTYFDADQRVGDHWQPTFFGVTDKRLKVAELGTLAGSERIVFGQRAVNVLLPLLGDSVELLPYPTELGTYYLVNVLDVGDYLDRERTQCREVLDNGICFGITNYVFREQLLRGKHMFRIPDDPVFRFVSGEFMALCQQHGLVGITSSANTLVWDSAKAPA